jgi:hypothetical protein
MVDNVLVAALRGMAIFHGAILTPMAGVIPFLEF